MNISGPIRTTPGRMTKGPMSEETRAAFARMDRFHAFWSAHYAEFRELYPDEFVAVADQKLVGHSRDFLELCDELDRLAVKHVQVEFVRVNTPSLVL